ncbi:uncharacterized protein LOC100375808 [Saccoglossus kowalevskii]
MGFWRMKTPLRVSFLLIGFLAGSLFTTFYGPGSYVQIQPLQSIKSQVHVYQENRHKVYRHINPVSVSKHGTLTPSEPKKYFIDCGGNTASSVRLFKDTYPNSSEYIIHSFEIDDRLKPFYAPYRNTEAHCPVAVSQRNGNVTAYSEDVWSPDKGPILGYDQQWGGGTLYAFNDEKNDIESGGSRKLTYRKTIPAMDLSSWIQKNTRIEDYVVLKMDVEGAEYGILKKMMDDGTFRWIDKLYGEYHDWQPTGYTWLEKFRIRERLKSSGFGMMNWEGEILDYEDFEKLHPPFRDITALGMAGKVINKCGSPMMAKWFPASHASKSYSLMLSEIGKTISISA